jgi:hypothetical protein
MFNETLNYTEYSYMHIEIDNFREKSQIPAITILTLLFIFGISLNAISVKVIFHSKKIEIISILILNLACADIIYLASIPFFTMNAFADSWPFGLIGCRVFYLLDYVGMTVGVYSVAALSFERLLVVTDNKKSLDKLSDKFKKFIVLIYLTLIWLVGILFSIPLLLYIELGKTIDDKYACGLHTNENEHFILLSVRFILIFLLPFTIILISSIKLILYVKKNNSVLKSKQTLISERKKSNVQTKNKIIKKKAIKIVLSIVLMFLIQWLPFRIGIYMF